MNEVEEKLLKGESGLERCVIEIWPHLSGREKWRLFFLALWYARVKNPARRFVARLGLTPTEAWFLVMLPVAILIGILLPGMAWLYKVARLEWWLYGASIALMAFLLSDRSGSHE